MADKLYTILEQGQHEDGRTWARYLDDQDEEHTIKVAPGYDLEEQIKEGVLDRKRWREEFESLSPEEQEKVRRDTKAMYDRWDRDYGPPAKHPQAMAGRQAYY